MNTDTPTPKRDAKEPRPSLWRRVSERLGAGRRMTEAEREALHLPPMSRPMQAFSMVAFFALGAAITAFVIANPFDLSFLPGSGQPPAARAATTSVSDGDAVYQCPMHPEVVQDTPGECPICGMDLVEVKSVPTASSRAAARAAGEREILYWYAPMDPTYIRDEPGVSPMGMKLVPKYADEDTSDEAGVIRIDPVQVQNIGVVTATAEIADIARHSRTVGILDFNADAITWVNIKFEGWIETVHVTYVGQEVREGQPLFEIYSPELVTTQEEYLRALDYRASLEDSGRAGTLRQADSLVQSTLERLTYWDVTDEQIRELQSSRQVMRRLTVTSPADGVVAEVMSEALEGMYAKPGMDLYKIANLSTVWVHADVYEVDIPWIRAGQPAVVSFRNAPGERFRGKVLFLYPEVSRDTRTLKICVEVPNPDRRLRPGMYADVVVEGPPVEHAVVAPQSAVIRSGERNIVFVALGDGRFQPREVELGVKGERDRIQIIEGVSAGESVVTQAQFMLDSESRMQEAIAQFRSRSKNGHADAKHETDPTSSGQGE
jgi:Cu(I)/Ag(I) efflux system membrane fusion protein/cobalt-zinc-cadmium efflux system membrane fusion protein